MELYGCDGSESSSKISQLHVPRVEAKAMLGSYVLVGIRSLEISLCLSKRESNDKKGKKYMTSVSQDTSFEMR